MNIFKFIEIFKLPPTIIGPMKIQGFVTYRKQQNKNIRYFNGTFLFEKWYSHLPIQFT